MTWNDHGFILIFGDYNFDLPYITIFIFFAILAAMGLPFVLFTKFFGSRNGQKCKWKGVPEGNKSAFTKWRCKECLVEAYSTDKRPPKECKKTLKVVL